MIFEALPYTHMSDNAAYFRKKRKRKQKWGLILFWGGLLMLLLDITTPFPTPVRGAFALWWLIAVAAGAFVYMQSRRLLVEETVILAGNHDGEWKITDEVSELNISLGTASRILYSLERAEMACLEQRGDIHVWVFPEEHEMYSMALPEPDAEDESGITREELRGFIAPCENTLHIMWDMLLQIEDETFSESVERFCKIVRKHINNFRKDPEDIQHFRSFPRHLEKMSELLCRYIDLSKHAERESAQQACAHLHETFDKAADKFDEMLDTLLLNDIRRLEANAETMERILSGGN